MSEQTKITGYRQLINADKELMNEIKQKGNEVGELLNKLAEMDGLDKRAINIAKTEIQTGFMWAIRGVAQPTTFA